VRYTVLVSINDRIEREFFSKKFFLDFFLKMTPMGVILMREIDCAHSQSVKTPSWPSFREKLPIFSPFLIFSQAKNRQFFTKTWSRWRFYASGVRAIDFSHQHYPHRGHFQKKIEKKFFQKKIHVQWGRWSEVVLINSNLLRNRWVITWCHPVYTYYEIDNSSHDVIEWHHYFEILFCNRTGFHFSNRVYKGSTY